MPSVVFDRHPFVQQRSCNAGRAAGGMKDLTPVQRCATSARTLCFSDLLAASTAVGS